MKNFFIFMTILALALPLGAESPRWVPVEGGTNVIEEPLVSTISPGETKISFQVGISGLFVQEEVTKGGSFHYLAFPNRPTQGEIGQAKLPVIRELVEIPYGAQLSITLDRQRFIEYPLSYFGIDDLIAPVQDSIIKTADGYEKWQFSKDEKYYAHNTYYPEQLVSIIGTDYYRAHRVAHIEISPVTYNPQNKTVRVYPVLVFDFCFENGKIGKTKKEIKRTWSESFEHHYASMFINYGMVSGTVKSRGEDRASYMDGILIISDPAFYSIVQPLAQWREKMGYYVQHVDTSATGTTVTSVKNYIQTAYNTWTNPPLSFVLLVGDVAQIPTPQGSSCSGCASDSDYVCISGGDNVPDVYIGRISVETPNQAQDVMDRFMMYTKAAFSETSWIKKAAFLSSCDSSYNSYHTHEWCQSNFTGPLGYSGTYYPGSVDPGGDLIRCIEDYGGSGSASGDDAVNAMNEGRSLFVYSGHGSYTSWGGPSVSQSDLQSATCGEMAPFMVGHCCIAHNIEYSSPCFGEASVRDVAIAYYGSSESSYWGEDDYLQKAWFEQIFDNGNHRMGVYTANAMLDMYNNYSSSRMDYYMDMELLGGDPTMELYTEIPQALAVTHDSAVPVGQNSFSVTVYQGGAPRAQARVCLIKNDGGEDMHAFGTTDASGQVTISMSPALGTVGKLNVTVTAVNALPYEALVDVIVPEGPWLTYNNHGIDDSTGNNDGIINPGENITMPVTLENIGADPGKDISATLTESSGLCTIVDNYAEYPNIIVSATGQSLANHYTFSVDSDAPNGQMLTFTLAWSADADKGQYNGSTSWSVTVQAPILEFNEALVDDATGAVPNGRLDPGETAKIHVNLLNSGGCPATGVQATLVEYSDYVNVTDNGAVWPTIAADSSQFSQAPHFEVAVDGSCSLGHQVNFELNITTTDGYNFIENFTLVVGSMGLVLVIDDGSGGSSSVISTTLSDLFYTVTEESAGTTIPSTWTDYDFIVHASGSNGSTVGALTTNLVDYVNQGGKLLLEGGEVMYDHDTEDPDFAANVMHCTDWNHDSSGNLNLAEPTHPIATTPNLLPSTIEHDFSGYGDEDAGTTELDATAVFTWSSYPNDAGVIAFDDDADPDNGGQIIFCSFNMATTANEANDRTHLIDNMAYWLMSYGAEPYELAYENNNFSDMCSLGGPGHDNGVAEPGETLDINVTLLGKGTSTVTGIDLTLSSPTQGVVVTTAQAACPDIPSGDYGTTETPFTVVIDPSFTCLNMMTFYLSITSNEGTWTGTFEIQVGQGGGMVEILSEDFSTWPPFGWSIENNVGGSSTWQQSPSDNSDAVNIATTPFAIVDSDGAGTEDMDEALITPPIDCTDLSVVWLEFDHYFNYYSSGNNEVGDVDVSTDGGMTWTNVLQFTASSANPEHVSENISSYVTGISTVYIRFHYYNANYEWYWAVDNVKVITESAALCNICSCPFPGSFDLVNPADGATDQPVNVHLDWQDSQDADSYSVYLGTTSPPSLYMSGLTQSSLDVADLSGNETYFWKVEAENQCGSTLSPEWSFTVVDCIPPGAFNLMAPENGIVVDPQNIVLDWADSSDAVSYTLYLGATTPPPQYQSGINTSTFTVPDLNIDVLYFWYIEAVNDCGTAVTDEWTFTTSPASPSANDDMDSSMVITAPDFSHYQNTTNATTAPDDPIVTINKFSGQGYHSVWYQFLPSSNGMLTVDTLGSSYDTMLIVWAGTRGDLELREYNDDHKGLQSQLSTPVMAGVSYCIEVISDHVDKHGTLHLSASFSAPMFTDVPTSFWARSSIETLYYFGITSGCAASPLKFCPNSVVTRDQMAIFLERGMHGADYQPAPATGIFDDVPVDFWAARWIEQLYSDSITSGCSQNPPLFCPGGDVTRDQMAIFLLRAKYGGSYSPPPASGTMFSDVPQDLWGAAWIEQLAVEGITSGCGGGKFCPNSPVSRDQMAVFLVRTFELIVAP